MSGKVSGPVLQWGIVGAGRISHDFVTALSTLPGGSHQVVAIASRHVSQAEEFAELHKISKHYDTFLGVAEDPNVEVVFVGCINAQHLEVCEMMLNHNKHVLCNNPLAINSKECSKIINQARDRKIFLMEGIWSRCFPAYDDLHKLIEEGVIGDIKQITCNFGYPFSEQERINFKEKGGGSILDLGIYGIQFQQFVLGKKRPIEILATGHLNDFGTDDAMSTIIRYPSGEMASIQTATNCVMPNEAYVVGTKGMIKVPNFWCPTRLCLPDHDRSYPLPLSDHPFNFTNSCGLRYEAEEVRVCIKNGLFENPSMTWDQSLELAEIRDLIRKQVGVIYLQDKI